MDARLRLGIVVAISLAVIVGVAVTGGRDDDTESVAGNGGETTTSTAEPDGTTTTTGPPSPGPDQATLDTVALKLTAMVTVDHPTSVVQRPGTEDLYVTSLEGKLLRAPKAGGSQEELADLADRISTQGESGLLDLAFDLTGQKLYLSLVETAGNLAVLEVPMAGTAPALDQARVIITVDSPSTVHHAGDVYVDPAGLLWVAVGDGGPSQATSRRAQDLLDLHGKILRLDVANPPAGEAYGIPADNPFVGREDAAPEVWAYGLRNPWRFWVDEALGALWVGDVGRSAMEEVDYVAGPGKGAGLNFGWPYFEGTTPVVTGPPPDLVAPILAWPHEGRCAVTGGAVYRGGALPALEGAYVYSDLCDGVIRAVSVVGGAIVAEREFDAVTGYPVGFGADADGELYVCSFDEGAVYRLDPA